METSVRNRTRDLLGRRRPRPAHPDTTIEGTARLRRRTKGLVRRLHFSDIAIIDHEGLDRIAAEHLVATRVPAVVYVARFSTGRYPNAGPLALAQAGVRVIE